MDCKFYIVFLTVFILSACQTTPQRPILYPNAQLEKVGKEQGERAIDTCMARATEYDIEPNKDGQVGKRAAQGAAIGAVSSAAWGLVRGDAGELAAAGAAAGLAGGAASGAIESSQANPAYQSFVQKCLAERGFEIIGWQ